MCWVLRISTVGARELYLAPRYARRGASGGDIFGKKISGFVKNRLKAGSVVRVFECNAEF